MTVEPSRPRRSNKPEADVIGAVRALVAARHRGADTDAKQPREDPRELREPGPELEQEFQAIYMREFPKALMFARRYGDDAEAEDAVQSVFMKVWEGYTLRPAYVFRPNVKATHSAILDMVHNELRRLGRRAKTWTRKAGYIYDEVVGVLRDAAAVEVTAAELELSELVARALDRLPLRQREVFLVVRFDEKSYAEAAAILGISPITVHNQLVKANGRMRDMLEEYEIPDPDWWTTLYSQPLRQGRKDGQE